MPADPKLNEKKILHVLRDKDVPITPNGMRSMASLVLLCCYDRKVKREFMAEMLDLTAETYILLARLETAMTVRVLYNAIKPEATTEKMDEQIHELANGVCAKRALFADKFFLVTECPTLADKIS